MPSFSRSAFTSIVMGLSLLIVMILLVMSLLYVLSQNYGLGKILHAMLQCKKVDSKRTFASIVLIMLILFMDGRRRPIDNPTFESIAKADKWLVDGQPVTFCPLCNAAIVFKRTVNGEVLRFGVSGNLRHSDLIMWDNKTLSWWQQFTGEAIVGDLTGTQLDLVPSQLVSFQDFKRAYPQGVVLSRQFSHSYGINPYTKYDSSEHPFLYLGKLDRRDPATARVLGYFSNKTAIVYPLTTIAKAGMIEDRLDGQSVVIFYAPGQVSALDEQVIADSKEVGSAAMFSAEVNGRKLRFDYHNGVIFDKQTRSQWDVFGRAINGKLMGTQLTPVLRSNVHFWFAWAAFKPETKVFRGM